MHRRPFLMYKSIDLFAGIGGIRLGFDQAFQNDIQTVFVSEWDKFACQTYQANFNDKFDIAGDITKMDTVEVPQFDICLAGFPCQAFSFAGKRQGFDDDFKGQNRGVLFLEVVRLCEYHKPKVIFCENVKGLFKHDKGRTFKVITEAFAAIGYKVFYQVLNSKNFGVPQNRERVYIVCFREDIAPETFEFPTRVNSPKTIQDILDPAPIPAKYYISDMYLETLKRHKERHAAKGNGFGYKVQDLNGIAGTLLTSSGRRDQNLIKDSRPHSMIPETKIKGNINTEDLRHFTPRECARLQGFPEDFILPVSDTQLYRQFGNSVTVPVIKIIAEKIKEVLDAE